MNTPEVNVKCLNQNRQKKIGPFLRDHTPRKFDIGSLENQPLKKGDLFFRTQIFNFHVKLWKVVF